MPSARVPTPALTKCGGAQRPIRPIRMLVGMALWGSIPPKPRADALVFNATRCGAAMGALAGVMGQSAPRTGTFALYGWPFLPLWRTLPV